MTRSSTSAALFALVCAGCGSSHPELDILDPFAVQYGKNYAEWAAEWVAYADRVAPPECADPFADASGASCGLYQDPASPVFFLAGTSEGVARRDECAVPAGKALFFPLIAAWRDNAGAPAEALRSDEDLYLEVESVFTGFLPNSLRLSVDGRAISRLGRGAISSAPYTVSLAAGANSYVCRGATDVAGDFSGYVSGYWALLPALTAGEHTLEFQSASKGPAGVEDVSIDVRYTLRVE